MKFPAATWVTAAVLLFFAAALLADFLSQATGKFKYHIPGPLAYIVFFVVFAATCVFLTPIAANIQAIALAYFQSRRDKQIEQTWKRIEVTEDDIQE